MDEALTQNVCGIAFVPGDESRVLLCFNKSTKGTNYYDGFGGPLLHPVTESQAHEKSASEYLAAATGIVTKPSQWIEIVTLRGDKWEVGFFYIISANLRKAKGLTPEHIVSHEKPLDLPLNIMPTLRWLIPLVLDDNVVKPLGLSGIKLLKEL